jgi:hypothetical protein
LSGVKEELDKAVVPVSMVGKLVPGMLVPVAPESPRNTTVAAQVTMVDRVIDAASGTSGVRLELPNPKYRLPAGLKCEVGFRR